MNFDKKTDFLLKQHHLFSLSSTPLNTRKLNLALLHDRVITLAAANNILLERSEEMSTQLQKLTTEWKSALAAFALLETRVKAIEEFLQACPSNDDSLSASSFPDEELVEDDSEEKESPLKRAK